MGGVAGHLAHLYDNRDLTFNEMAKILQKAASGELVGTEKTDGYNIYLGYVDGKPRAARNKGDMSRGGMTFEDLINREFRGGEDSKRAYVTAFNSYVSALDSLSEKEKAQIFGPNGEIFYNTEIQGPVAPNVVNYDENVVNIHRMGHKKYNKEDNTLEVVANEKESAFLDSVIDRFEEATANEDFRVRRTAFLTLNKITDEAFVEEVLNRIKQTGYSGNMTINDYLHDKLTPYTAESLPELDDQRVELLVRRMLGDKSAPTTTQITKGMDRETKAKVSAFNKNSKFLIKKLIEPIEMAIHDFAVELLRGLKSAYILDNESEVERLKNETESAIRAIESYEGPEQEAAQDILVRQLTKLKHHDNIDTVVEGFVFQHDGQMYKFTGNFAPMNQLLGLFRYGRGKIPQMVKEMLREQNEGEIVAILPGKFKPAHRGHLDMIKHYAQLADRVVVLVSPKEKDGITAQTAAQILNMYLDDANITNTDVEIPEFASPVRAAMEYGNSPEMEGTKIILGASTKGGDAAERFGRNVQKYVENAEVLNPLDYAFDPVGEVLSATDFRNALRSGGDVERFLPDTSKDRVQDIVDMVKVELKEVNDPFLGIFRGLVDEVLQERAESEQQRKWACAQMGKSRKKFKGKPALSKKEAKKMCTDPLKEENEEIIYFPAKHLKSTKGEYSKEQEWKDFAKLSDRDKIEWAKGVSLEDPIQVTVYVDGTFGFEDGHHRAMAGRLLNKEVPIKIKQSHMPVKYPEAWEKWKEVTVTDKRNPKEINPEGYLIKDPEMVEYLLGSLEETVAAAVQGTPGPVGRVKRRNISETEVNEALNYLLQKLGV